MNLLASPKTVVSGFLISTLFIFLTISCDSPTDCGPFHDKFSVKGFYTSAKQITHYDSSTRSIQLSDAQSDTVRYTEYAIEMLPEAEFYYSGTINKLNFRLVRSAYACSPSIPVSDDTILDLKIFSDTDFNSEYPAGKDLRGIFDVYAHYMGEGLQRFSLSDFIADNPSVPDQLILLLNESPAEAAGFQFTIHYSQDGDKLTDYEFTTRTLTISP